MIHCYVWCGPRFLGSCFIYWLGSQNIIDIIALVLQGCIWGSSQGYHGLHRGGFGLHWLHRWQQVLNCVLDPLRNQWIIVTLPSAPCFKEVWWFSAVFQSSFHCFHSGRASLMPRLESLWTSTSSSSSPGTITSGATATVSSTWSATCSRPSRAFRLDGAHCLSGRGPAYCLSMQRINVNGALRTPGFMLSWDMGCLFFVSATIL